MIYTTNNLLIDKFQKKTNNSDLLYSLFKTQDLANEIFSFLEIQDLDAIMFSCKYFHKLLTTEPFIVFKQKYEELCNEKPPSNITLESLKEKIKEKIEVYLLCFFRNPPKNMKEKSMIKIFQDVTTLEHMKRYFLEKAPNNKDVTIMWSGKSITDINIKKLVSDPLSPKIHIIYKK